MLLEPFFRGEEKLHVVLLHGPLARRSEVHTHTHTHTHNVAQVYASVKRCPLIWQKRPNNQQKKPNNEQKRPIHTLANLKNEACDWTK